MIALLITLVLAAIVFLVFFSKTPRRGSRTNRPYGEFNLEGPYRRIGREIEQSWKHTAQGLYLSNQTNLSEEEKFSLQNASIEVYLIIPVTDDFVIAFAWVDNQGRPIPAIVRAALMGVPEELVERVQPGRQVAGGNPMPPDAFQLACMSDGRRWNFKAWEEEDGSVKHSDLPEEVHAVIGEPVLIQNGYKEPPFAVTVLGPAEPVNEQVVKVPVRITAIIPRWSYGHAGEIGAYLETAPDGNGKSRQWGTHEVSPEVRQEHEPEPIPRNLTLVKRGSYEGYLWFGPDRTGEDVSAPDEPFIRLHFIDGSEQVIEVDLTQSVEPARRVRFENGQPDDRWLPTAVMARLESYDSSWSNLPDPASAVLGDTVSIPLELDGSPYVDLTVLGFPERAGDKLARLPVRVVARYAGGPHSCDIEAQLSTAPDSFGRIHHVFADCNDLGGSGSIDGAIDLDGMQQGEAREGFLYFCRDYEDPDQDVPDEPFTSLWYGPTMFELPMDLTITRQ